MPDVIRVVTMDLSYLSIARALPQLARVRFAEGADFVLLVKPMFELALDHAPHDAASLDEAVERACLGVESSGLGLRVVSTMKSPVAGARGAIELFVHARTGFLRSSSSRATVERP